MGDPVVIVAYMAFTVFVVFAGFWLGSTLYRYFNYQVGYEKLPLLVKDAGEHVTGSKYCSVCGDPLTVYALKKGFDRSTGEPEYERFGRCEKWRAYSLLPHDKLCTFDTYTKEEAERHHRDPLGSMFLARHGREK